jgi:hypothetical protein
VLALKRNWRSFLRRRRVVLLLAALGVAPLAYVPLRATVFAPRYDVPSIAATPQYQDGPLLERAWALPVAKTYDHRVVWQSNGSVCGPASVANLLRSLGDAGASQATVLDGTGKCRTGLCIPGLTLDELADIARRKTNRKITVVRDIGIEELREHLRRTNDLTRRYLVNFHRGLLFGKGVGHHSPIAGYLEAEDLVLVLDVNDSFGPWLVSTPRLFRAMDSVDGSSGKKRGLIVFEGPDAAPER